MENAAPAPAIAKPSLSKKPSPSFRLRNRSLNALRLRRVFDLFDSNGDGEITLDEMASALNALGLGADLSDLEEAVGGYIPAGAAGLRFEDFESLDRALGDALFGPILDEVPDQEDDDDEGEMKEAFRVFDEDGDGFISAAELQAVLKKLGLPEARSLASVQEMICNVDRNFDGQVDFGEFKNMMRGITREGKPQSATLPAASGPKVEERASGARACMSLPTSQPEADTNIASLSLQSQSRVHATTAAAAGARMPHPKPTVADTWVPRMVQHVDGAPRCQPDPMVHESVLGNVGVPPRQPFRDDFVDIYTGESVEPTAIEDPLLLGPDVAEVGRSRLVADAALRTGTVQAHGVSKQRHDTIVPRRSSRLAAKSSQREQKPEAREKRRVMLNNNNNKNNKGSSPGSRAPNKPDEAIAMRYKQTFQEPLLSTTKRPGCNARELFPTWTLLQPLPPLHRARPL